MVSQKREGPQHGEGGGRVSIILPHNGRPLIHLHLGVLKDQFTVAKKESRESKGWNLSEKKARHYNLTCYADNLKTWENIAAEIQIEKRTYLHIVRFCPIAYKKD